MIAEPKGPGWVLVQQLAQRNGSPRDYHGFVFAYYEDEEVALVETGETGDNVVFADGVETPVLLAKRIQNEEEAVAFVHYAADFIRKQPGVASARLERLKPP